MKYSKEYSKKVLNASDIVVVISDYTQLKQNGAYYVAKCPFDKKKIESLIVFPETNTFHCFECGTNGNAATFLMKKENISFDEAIDKLAQRAGITPTEQDLRMSKDEIAIDLLKKTYHDAATYYVNILNSADGKIGLDYLKGRKLKDETIRRFGLGFAPAKGNGLYKHLHQLGYSDDLLQQAGLIKISETGPYDFFRNRVMFPIINENNDVVAFSGRVMDDSKPKYLNSPESLIFNKGNTFYGMNIAVKKAKGTFLLCEGQMDVISLHQAGFHSAIAPMGTAMTQAHVPFITSHANNVVITTDSDAAGRKAVMRAIKNLADTDIKIRVLDMTPYKDPDEFIKALGAEAYQERIKESMPAEDFIIKNLGQQFDLTNPEEKEKYLRKAVDTIMSFQDKKQERKNEREDRVK